MNIFELLRVTCSLTINLTHCWLRERDTILRYTYTASLVIFDFTRLVCVCELLLLLFLLLLLILSLLFMIIAYVIILSSS